MTEEEDGQTEILVSNIGYIVGGLFTTKSFLADKHYLASAIQVKHIHNNPFDEPLNYDSFSLSKSY